MQSKDGHPAKGSLRPLLSLEELAPHLERLYAQYTLRSFVDPDPLAAVYRFSRPEDQEIAGLLSAAFAFGNVKQILVALGQIFTQLPEPRRNLEAMSHKQLTRRFTGFQYRYIKQDQLLALLAGVQALLKEYGGLGGAFEQQLSPDDSCVASALAKWIALLDTAGGVKQNYLLPSPLRGSACKRLFLYLRWMIRHDPVDLGLWPVPARLLVVPLDTHMHQMALALGLTHRKNASLSTALEVTEQFRRICPEDPVRYDFALTRLGIRKALTPAAYAASLTAPPV